MFGRTDVSNKDLTKTVNQRLSRTGTLGQSQVAAGVQRGIVTLTGTIRHEMQRRALMLAASRAPGVRQVIDQMTLAVKKKF
jgi:osmotically-inducible protein OsmY